MCLRFCVDNLGWTFVDGGGAWWMTGLFFGAGGGEFAFTTGGGFALTTGEGIGFAGFMASRVVWGR